MDAFLELRRYFPSDSVFEDWDGSGDEVGKGEEEGEEDPEALPAQSKEATVLYNILYDPNYRVPVMYFTPPPPPQSSSAAVSAALGFVDGAVSQGEHLLTGDVWWFVHPCRTAEEMAGRVGGEGYLAMWLGTVGGGLAGVVRREGVE